MRLNNRHNGRRNGIMVFFFKIGGRRDIINNYRRITILPALYKHRAEILSNRLTTILNILTGVQQCAYNTKKSTAVIIFEMVRNIIVIKLKGIFFPTFPKHSIVPTVTNSGIFFASSGALETSLAL